MGSELEEKMEGKREPHKLSDTLDEGTTKLLKDMSQHWNSAFQPSVLSRQFCWL